MSWWRGAVFYQIYPRSFASSDGSGVGDLQGITERLPYVASLGVDAIWLSPFFASPMADYGYDVSDYRAVDPMFGTLADFDRLLQRAHDLGLRVVIDQVYSHTSDRHAWFADSCEAGEKRDWYVWADPQPDGTPPNNWIAVFGGQAWSWDTRRRQYYLHNFLREQPDLNFHEAGVQDAVLDVARYWLDRGVDGFRLDVANYYFHDARLRNNTARADGPGLRPRHFQHHRYDRSQPETLSFMRRLRSVLDEYDDRFSVAEIDSDAPVARAIQYTEGPDLLHTAYSFAFLHADEVTPTLVRETVEGWQGADAWPSWSFSNHDVARVASRWGAEDRPMRARALLALLLSLRGTIFLYQGEELGLPQADVPFERLRDPEAIRFYPNSLGRDGCRTPMPWTTEEHAGFSSEEPWLPVDPRHPALSVAAQESDPDSTLGFARAFLALRRTEPALTRGDIMFEDAPEGLCVFTRSEGADTLLCAFDLGGAGGQVAGERLLNAGLLPTRLGGRLTDGTLTIPPDGGAVVRL